MKVYTYFEDSPSSPKEKELLSLWAPTWARFGWDPVVLTRADAIKHPRYAELLAVSKRYPRVTSDFEGEVYLIRHCALPATRSLLVDYDIICNGLTPAAFDALKFPNQPGAFIQNGGFCGDNDWLINEFINWVVGWKWAAFINGRAHVCDMWVKRFLNTVDLYAEHRLGSSDQWHIPPAIHFSVTCAGKTDSKIQKIKDFLASPNWRGNQERNN